MNFDTAIFYDIENLLRGYNFSQQMLANFSLAEVLDAIKRTGRLGGVAVQRAYANWSDPRLAVLRGEINELGIDPIQVFGFSRDRTKNAADIQLSIDAVDLAHIRPSLEVFVIVSGDGGFASLAKKLHEYGKTVVGCAYRTAASRTFQAVCDEFVQIADPEGDDPQSEIGHSIPGYPSPEVSDPRNARLALRIKPAATADRETVLAKARQVLTWYADDTVCRNDLKREGIHLSVIREAIRYAVPEFQPVRLGFPKFIEFLQFCCAGTRLCVVRTSDTQPILALRDSVPSGADILPDLGERDLHCESTYRALLGTGGPIFRLPPRQALAAVVQWIAQHPPQRLELGTIVEEVSAGLGGDVPSESVKLAILSLVSADAFQREPEAVPIAEQKLTLKEDLSSPAALHAVLRQALRTKLIQLLGEIEEDVLDHLLTATLR